MASRLGVVPGSMAGSGLNASRSIAARYQPDEEFIEAADSLLNEVPEMVVSENVTVTGTVNFKRLFRIDGNVEAEFKAPRDASVIIGPTGKVVGNLSGLHTVFVEGSIVGNVDVEYVSLKASGSITGDVKCRFMDIQPRATLRGAVYVSPTVEVPEDPASAAASPTKPGAPKKCVVFIVDPQVDKCSEDLGAVAVPGAEADCERIAAFLLQNIRHVDEVVITMESRHRMHITHPLYWTDEHGGRPRPGTVIGVEDVESGAWRPANPANKDHCVSYLLALQELPEERTLTVQTEHCLIGTNGHAVMPVINSAVQKWAEISGKRVTYVMKGSNCATEMYSALSADVPVEEDKDTYADNELIGRLHRAERVVVAGQSLSHAVNYTVKDMLRLLGLYRDQFDPQPEEVALPAVGSKLWLLQDGCSVPQGYSGVARDFVAFAKAQGVNVCKIADVEGEFKS